METKFPVIKITGISDKHPLSLGCKVSINEMDLPTIKKAVVVFETDSFAEVTLTLCGTVDLEGLKAIPNIIIKEVI